MSNTNIIGNKITNARKQLNLSQAQLGQQINISAQAVGKWERGESLPDIITLHKLATIFGVDLNFFVEESLDIPPTLADPIRENDESINRDIKKGKKISWNMSRSNWLDADFSGVKGLYEKFNSSNIKNCKFIDADLAGLTLKSNDVVKSDFSHADLSRCTFQSSDLSQNQYIACMMKESSFLRCDIRNCDFSQVDFSGASFRYSTVQNCIVRDAVWNSVSFHAVLFKKIAFNGTIENCSFENSAFVNITFEDTTLLNTFFKGNNTRRIKFVNCKVDSITYEFLKNAKVDLSGIEIFA
jgi:uncharacterized protein YjbI with pentapeptide repeats